MPKYDAKLVEKKLSEKHITIGVVVNNDYRGMNW